MGGRPPGAHKGSLEVVDLRHQRAGGLLLGKGTMYICKYRTYRVYPVGSDETKSVAREYELNNEGSYVLQTAYADLKVEHRFCFNATCPCKDIGRLTLLLDAINSVSQPTSRTSGWLHFKTSQGMKSSPMTMVSGQKVE